MQPILRIIAMAALAVFGVAGCTSAPPHPYAFAPGHDGVARVGTVLLAPLNLAVALPAELQHADEQVTELIRAYLEGCGVEVVDLGFYYARDFWRSAIREVEAAGESESGFEAAATRFIGSLRERHAFDILVMPSLVYRLARFIHASNTVVWDGVKRSPTMTDAPTSLGSFSAVTTGAGRMDAVSLHVYVFGDGGQKIFESYAGMDVVHEAVFEGMRYRMQLRRERLTDEAALREGIALAFDPYLVPSERGAPQ